MLEELRHVDVVIFNLNSCGGIKTKEDEKKEKKEAVLGDCFLFSVLVFC